MPDNRRARTVNVFCEDVGHEVFLRTLLQRHADEYNIPITVRIVNASGGYGRTRNALRRYIEDLRDTGANLPDLFVVVVDGNCKGFVQVRQEIMQIVGEYDTFAIYAIPDPHIERWLLDSAAFKQAVGKGCAAPDQKCDRDRYKNLLQNAVREAGVTPLLRGLEYAEDIVRSMDLPRMERAGDSLGKLLKDLREKFSQWA